MSRMWIFGCIVVDKGDIRILLKAKNQKQEKVYYFVILFAIINFKL